MNSEVLKTARCLGNLLEGHIELSKVVVLMVMVYCGGRICMNRKEPRRVVHRVGPGELQVWSAQLWTPGRHSAPRMMSLAASCDMSPGCASTWGPQFLLGLLMQVWLTALVADLRRMALQRSSSPKTPALNHTVPPSSVTQGPQASGGTVTRLYKPKV